MRVRDVEGSRSEMVAEMRWVVPDGAYEEDEIESFDDGIRGGSGGDNLAVASGSRSGCLDADEDDEEDLLLRQRLVRTGPRANS